MRSIWLAALVVVMGGSSTSLAQSAPGPFHWRQGDVLIYRAEHLTSAAETVGTTKSETKTALKMTKHWQVLAVDAEGVATLRLSLLALSLETTTPRGEVIRFDSDDAGKSDPHLKEQLGGLIGQPLALVRVAPTGRVVEVKESKHGPASRFESEPPFVLTFATPELAAGQSWERKYAVTLEPPQGTGEKFDAVQSYTCKAVKENEAVIHLQSTLEKLPESPLDRIPLLQMQPAGEITFDLSAGRLKRAELHIQQELTGHQGEGSSYQFRSTYSEEYVGSRQ